MRNIVAKILIFLIIVIALIGGGAYIVFGTDMFKSDKELFYRYLLIKNIANFKELNLEGTEILSMQGKNSEFSGKLKIPSLKESLKTEKDLSFETKMINDAEKNDFSGRYMIKYGNDDFFGINLIKKGEMIGISSEGIAEGKYIAFENNDLKTLAKNFGAEDTTSIPNKIEFGALKNSKTFDLKKLNNARVKYSAIIDEKIPDYKYVAEENIQLSLSDKTIDTKRYSLIIKEKEYYELMYTLLQTLVDDNETLGIIAELLVEDNSDTKAIEEKSKEIKEIIINARKNLEKDKSNYSEVDNYTLSVYAYKGKCVKTEFSDAKENSFSYAIDTAGEKDKIEMKSTEVRNEDEFIDVGSNTTITIENNSTNNNVDFTYKTIVEYDKDDIKTAEEDSFFFDEEDYKNSTSTITFKANENANKETEIEIISKTGNKEDFKFTGKLRKDIDTKIKDLTEENSINLTVKSKEEIDSTMSTISSDIGNILAEKIDILFPGFGSLLGQNISFSSNEQQGDDTQTVSEDVIINDINYALKDVLDEYVTECMFNENVDPNEFLNGEKIKSYCDYATNVELTETSIIYTATDGKTYTGTVTTDIDTGYLMVTEISLQQN